MLCTKAIIFSCALSVDRAPIVAELLATSSSLLLTIGASVNSGVDYKEELSDRGTATPAVDCWFSGSGAVSPSVLVYIFDFLYGSAGVDENIGKAAYMGLSSWSSRCLQRSETVTVLN